MKRQDDLYSFSESPSPGTFTSQGDTQIKTRKHSSYFVIPVVGVLLIGAILGASFLFMRQLHSSTTITGPVSQDTTLSHQCLLNVQNLDEGLEYVCQHHLYQTLHQTLHVDKLTVTVKQGYADMNRVALAYTAKQGDKDITQGTLLNMTLNAQQGYVFKSLSIPNSGVVSFNTARPLTNIQTLNLQLGIALLNTPTFVMTHFSLPLHTEQRLLHVPQTIHSNGIALTLTSGIASLSETNFSFVFSQSLNTINAHVGPDTLYTNGKRILCGEYGNGDRTNSYLHYTCPLYDEQGQWIIQITAMSMQSGKIVASWTFKFQMD